MNNKAFIIIVICSFVLSGCWNRREFNELAITYGIGIDKVDDGILLTAQVINPEQLAEKKSGGSGSPVVIYEAKEKTVLNALRKLALNSPRKIYVAHLYILVISEEVAKEGLRDVLDLFYRDQEIRSDFFVLVSKNRSAKEILSVSTPFLVAPTKEIYDQLKFSDKNWDPIKATTIREVITKTMASGIHPVIPSVKPGIDDSNQQNKNAVPHPPLPTGAMAVLHYDKLAGWLDYDQARTYNTIINNITNSVTNFPCQKGGYGVLDSSDVKTKLIPKYKNEPSIDVHITINGRISELDCDQVGTSTNSIKKLDKHIETYLENFYTTQTQKIQKDIGVDIFGFGQEFRRKKPHEWNKMENDWDNIFKDLKVNIKVSVNISSTGTVADSLMNQVKGAK